VKSGTQGLDINSAGKVITFPVRFASLFGQSRITPSSRITKKRYSAITEYLSF
jgi:hypothetical protein